MNEALAAENPERYMPDLGRVHRNVGVFYTEQEEYLNADEHCSKAIEIFEALANKSPERYTPDLAMSYFAYAMFSNDSDSFEKALKLAKEYPENRMCKRIIDRLRG